MQLKRTIAALVLLSGFGIPLAVPEEDRSPAPPSESESLPLASVQALAQAYQLIQEHYVEEVEGQRLIESAIEGMTKSVDKYSGYLNPGAADAFNRETSGKYKGLGFYFHVGDTGVVMTPIENSPASRAGISGGDLLVRINGEPVQGLNQRQLSQLLREDEKAPIRLNLKRHKTGKTYTVELQRQQVHVRSVRWTELLPGYIYLRITQFQQETAQDFQRALDAVLRASPSGVLGLVLDLRQNVGGLIRPALKIADTLLEEGLMVELRGRHDRHQKRYAATPGQRLPGVPVTILIDSHTASASEILAAALQQQHRAVVVGQRSYGKGATQSVFPLGGGRLLKLTTALYYTPKGQSLEQRGVVPDVLVPPRNMSGPVSLHKLSALHGNEKILDVEALRMRLSEIDYALFEAMNVLMAQNRLRVRTGTESELQ